MEFFAFLVSRYLCCELSVIYLTPGNRTAENPRFMKFGGLRGFRVKIPHSGFFLSTDAATQKDPRNFELSVPPW